MQRKELKKIGFEKRERYAGTVSNFGIKNNSFKGFPERTMLLKDVKQMETGNVVTDHLWLTVGKTLQNLNLKVGDIIIFNARVGTYRKGKNFSKQDYKLNRLTDIEVKSAKRNLEEGEITSAIPVTINELKEIDIVKQYEREYEEYLAGLSYFDDLAKNAEVIISRKNKIAKAQSDFLKSL